MVRAVVAKGFAVAVESHHPFAAEPGQGAGAVVDRRLVAEAFVPQ